VSATNACGGVAVGAEHGRQREPPRSYQRRTANGLENPAAIRHAEGHLAGHQTVSGRRANGRGTVRVGEAHPFAGEAVEMRRGHLRLVVVTTHVPQGESSRLDTVSVFSYFRGVKNITISMPDELAHKVRVLAAKADTSMSQYLCQLAAEKAETDDGYTAAKVRYLSRDRNGLRLAGQKLPTRDEIHDRNALR